MNEKDIRALLERQINGVFLKAKLLRFPKFNIGLKEPKKNGYIETSDGKGCIANIGSNNGIVYHYRHTDDKGNLLYEEEVWEQPIKFIFPLGKNEYCYTHLARHEAVHYIRSLGKPSEEKHDRTFWDIGNLLFPDFEYRSKNLCQECPDKRFKGGELKN